MRSQKILLKFYYDLQSLLERGQTFALFANYPQSLEQCLAQRKGSTNIVKWKESRVLKPKGTLETTSVHSPYFTDDETKVQRATGSCPNSTAILWTSQGLNLDSLNSQVLCPLPQAAILSMSLLLEESHCGLAEVPSSLKSASKSWHSGYPCGRLNGTKEPRPGMGTSMGWPKCHWPTHQR